MSTDIFATNSIVLTHTITSLFYGGYVVSGVASGIVAYDEGNRGILNLNVSIGSLVENFIMQKQSLLWTIDDLTNQTWKINYYQLKTVDNEGIL